MGTEERLGLLHVLSLQGATFARFSCGPAPSPESVPGILMSLLVMPLGSRNLGGPLKALSTERGDLRRVVWEKRISGRIKLSSCVWGLSDGKEMRCAVGWTILECRLGLMTESDSSFDIKTTVATRNAQICLESAGFSVTENFMYRSMTTEWWYDRGEYAKNMLWYCDSTLLLWFFPRTQSSLFLSWRAPWMSDLTGFIHLPVLLFFQIQNKELFCSEAEQIHWKNCQKRIIHRYVFAFDFHPNVWDRVTG